MVYSIQCGKTKLVKIGHTRDPIKRLADLQACSPTLLFLLDTTAGNYKQEQLLHLRFRDKRVHGEWFRLDPLEIKVCCRSKIVAECKCGRSYTDAGWRDLPLDGIQHVGDGGSDLELRTCVCGSTLGCEIECTHGPGPREDRTIEDLQHELASAVDPAALRRSGLSEVEWRQALERALRSRLRSRLKEDERASDL